VKAVKVSASIPPWLLIWGNCSLLLSRYGVFTFDASPSRRRFMRAEAQNHVDKIQQALALLRRFL
jgi:hypothetical protein